MSFSPSISVLERTRPRFRDVCQQHGLLNAGVSVTADSLTPQEAIGDPDRRDFPIIVGNERVLESAVLGSRGHAFTDSPRPFSGVVEEVIGFDLSTNANRAVYVATLNATLGRLKMARATVHCRDNDPERCAVAIASGLLDTHGRTNVGLIGLNPAIAERLVEVFGPERVRISDLNPKNAGQRRFGVEVRDGRDGTEELIDASEVVVFTGTTLVNGTFDAIWNRIRSRKKSYLVYGVTAAGVCELMEIPRICPRGREG